MNLSVCVIGVGIIAKHHLEAISKFPELKLLAVADIDSNKAMKIASQYGVKGYSAYQEMIVKEAPDLVINTLPHFLHKEATIFAAKEDCHILLEKPMALTSEECQEIRECVKASGVKLMVAHTQHYLAENIVAKNYIDTHDLGPLLMVNDARHVSYFHPDRPKWFLEKKKAGGGILMNLGAHSIDKIQWLTQSTFSYIKANLHYPDPQQQTDVEGSGTVYLETSDGVPVTISMSGFTVIPTQRTELIFKRGMVKIEMGEGVFVSHDGNELTLKVPKFPDPFILQLEDMMKRIRDETCGNGQYGQSIIQIIEGIYKSDQLKKGINLGTG
ncbi:MULTISPECIES: Gfo/Idh/MocA family protein [Pontibacillus]|uniref:Gfo/Idh/MocA family oxidoreductase n=1 Tax=Pontibacillus chungwhensis TaxID=265426 RepID=A0ABY8US43_9BACI|nr:MULTISPECIES: Gfo/Idh/MocA family oxidoreductase [Pontibacillus]MCD5322845.1 Gfo/Idh/MocA family oxidoreductase [Pontibacillus sp. HN14]WIF96243.1 Gfo/Idh/MocA family oxidoreductase [Pontibacillus chungwhensis]